MAEVIRGHVGIIRISEFFWFQWQNLAEILSLLPKVLQSENEAVIMITSPLYNICPQQMWLFESLFRARGPNYTKVESTLIHQYTVQLRCHWSFFLSWICKCCNYAYFLSHYAVFFPQMSWLRAFWGRILAEILAEILRNTQNFGRNSEEKVGHWSLC